MALKDQCHVEYMGEYPDILRECYGSQKGYGANFRSEEGRWMVSRANLGMGLI